MGMSMTKVKVTEKFQVTIPKDVREKIGMKPGEIVEVIPVDETTIMIKRMKIKDPLKLLIGREKLFDREIGVEEVEEAAEGNIH